MDVNRLTEKSREAVLDAQNIATRLANNEVDSEHLLLALIQQKDGLLPRLLQRLSIDSDTFAGKVENELSRRPHVTGPGADNNKLYMTQRLNRVLARAEEEASALKDDYISVEHIVLALIEEGPNTISGRLLSDAGLSRERFLKALQDVRRNQRVTSATPEVTYEALERYGRDLVAEARAGKLDPVIGRDAEIRRPSASSGAMFRKVSKTRLFSH